MNLIVQELCSAKESSDYKARRSQCKLFIVCEAQKHSSSMAGNGRWGHWEWWFAGFWLKAVLNTSNALILRDSGWAASCLS